MIPNILRGVQRIAPEAAKAAELYGPKIPLWMRGLGEDAANLLSQTKDFGGTNPLSVFSSMPRLGKLGQDATALVGRTPSEVQAWNALGNEVATTLPNMTGKINAARNMARVGGEANAAPIKSAALENALRRRIQIGVAKANVEGAAPIGSTRLYRGESGLRVGTPKSSIIGQYGTPIGEHYSPDPQWAGNFNQTDQSLIYQDVPNARLQKYALPEDRSFGEMPSGQDHAPQFRLPTRLTTRRYVVPAAHSYAVQVYTPVIKPGAGPLPKLGPTLNAIDTGTIRQAGTTGISRAPEPYPLIERQTEGFSPKPRGSVAQTYTYRSGVPTPALTPAQQAAEQATRARLAVHEARQSAMEASQLPNWGTSTTGFRPVKTAPAEPYLPGTQLRTGKPLGTPAGAYQKTVRTQNQAIKRRLGGSQ